MLAILSETPKAYFLFIIVVLIQLCFVTALKSLTSPESGGELSRVYLKSLGSVVLQSQGRLSL